MVLICAFSYAPLSGWWYAFTDYKVGQGFQTAPFVGLRNFVKLTQDSELIRVLRNTMVISGLGLLTSPLAILFAIMLNELRSPKYQRFVQTVTTFPNFISWIVVFGVAFTMFSSNGMLNQLLGLLNLPKSQTGLIGDSKSVWPFQLALTIWKGLGWDSIIYLAAIAGIDTELYDAARVDGANKMQLVRHITIPGVLPTYLVLLLLAVSNMLSNGFDQYYMFWNSLTADRIEVLDYYIYKLAFRAGQYSYSIALCVFKSVFSIVMLSFVNLLSKRVRGYSII